MSETIFVSLIAAFASVLGSYLANLKQSAVMQEKISTIKEDIKELTAHVEQHNNFGLEIKEIKTEIKNLKERIDRNV